MSKSASWCVVWGMTAVLMTAGWSSAQEAVTPATPAAPVAESPAESAAPATASQAPAPPAAPPVAVPGPTPEAQDEKKLADASAPAKAAEGPSASQQLAARRDKFLADLGLHVGPGNAKGAYVGWAELPVGVPATDPSWPKARVFAYMGAVAKAQADFLTFTRQQTVGKTVVEVMGDDSQLDAQKDIERLDEKSQVDVVKDKALALTEATLDEKLRAAGVDPKDFEGRPKVEKALKLSDRIAQKATISAAQSLSGLRTLQTFTGHDEKNVYKVGVLVVHSPNFQDLAQTIARGRSGPRGLLPPGAKAYEQLPQQDEAFLDDFGVRVLVDEHGDRCLLAFGQWAVADQSGSERLKERRLDVAREQARVQADTALAQFAKSTVIVTMPSEVEQRLEDYVRTLPKEKQTERLETAEFVDVLNQNLSVNLALTISGLSTIRTWQAKHPLTGHQIVGVVRMWSPTSEQQAKDILTRRPADGRPQQGAEGKGKSGSSQGNTYDKLKDW